MRSRLLAAALLLAAWAALAAFAAPARAWDRHDLITRAVLRNTPWLDRYKGFEVLPASGSECADCDKDPYNPDYFPLFINRLPGERTSAREVLVRYVDEPDWGMDENISAAVSQALAGGSKGWRHQRYYYATGIVKVGGAPERVEHFYKLAVAAYAAGDRYWAFRHLARSLHYLQDMGQPLHTRPFQYSWFRRTKLDAGRMTTLAKNFHYAYERLVTKVLREEIRRDGGPLLGALRKPPKLKFTEGEWLQQLPWAKTPAYTAARALAEYSSNRAPDLLKWLDAYLPKRVKSTRQVVVPTPAELAPGRVPAAYADIMASTRRSFEVTAGSMVSVLEMARRDFEAADKARLGDD